MMSNAVLIKQALQLLEHSANNVVQKTSDATTLTTEERQGMFDAIYSDIQKLFDSFVAISHQLESLEVVRKQLQELKESRQ
jgi:alcohol dehydrogenase class IV